MRINFFPCKNKYVIAALVLFIVPLSGMSIDIYVPSLPAVTEYFHVTKNLSQLSITAYLIGLSVMQLFAGSLSDSMGRKKPFMIAFVLYIMVTFLMTYTTTIYQLLFLRLMQGAALAVTVVPMRSVISDLFEGTELQKMMTYMTMAWSLGPILAPAIGGYLQFYVGWKANFYFLGIYSFIMLILACLFLFETSSQHHPLQLRKAFERYRTMLIHQEYLNSILVGGLLFSIITLFGIAGPFLIQTVLHYTANQFGHITLLMGFAWFLGAMANRFLLHIPLAVKAKIGLSLMLIVSLMMFMVAINYPIIIYNIVIPMSLLFFFNGMLYPSYFIRCVLLFRNASASANALYNSSAFFIAAIISGLGTFIKLNTEISFICVLMTLIALCLMLYYLDFYRVKIAALKLDT